MRTIMSLFISLCVYMGLAAQDPDSVIMEEIMGLRMDIVRLQSGQKSLSAGMVSANESQDESIRETRDMITEIRQSLEETNDRINGLDQALEEHKQQADQERTSLEEWIKKMLMILGIVFLVLLVILLVLMISNRGKINRESRKMEAGMDHLREILEGQIKEVQKKHEEDLSVLKASIEKDKKK